MTPIKFIKKFYFQKTTPWVFNVDFPRELTATWDPELVQDVSAFHNMDVEAELTNILNQQLVNEINFRLLQSLIEHNRQRIQPQEITPTFNTLPTFDFI